LRKTSTILDLFAGVPRMGYSVIRRERIMAKTETIRARVEAKLKADAEAVLDELGLTASDAIRLFYKQVALRRGLPFDVVIPNAATRKAMRDVISRSTRTRVRWSRSWGFEAMNSAN
jgi:DNA-damage-inducible protein J